MTLVHPILDVKKGFIPLYIKTIVAYDLLLYKKYFEG